MCAPTAPRDGAAVGGVMACRMAERWRRLRFALRWAWTGQVNHKGITVVCSHPKPGDVEILMTYRGVKFELDVNQIGTDLTTTVSV